MARPHQSITGRTYQIRYHGDRSVTVNCTYLCPYCKQVTNASFEANGDAVDIIERGGFFEPLQCDLCGKVSDVRFYSNNKI